MTNLVLLRKDAIHGSWTGKNNNKKDDRENEKRQAEEIRSAALEGIKEANTDVVGRLGMSLMLRDTQKTAVSTVLTI